MFRRIFRSVRTQMTLWNVGVVALSLIGFGLALRFSVERILWDAVDRDLRERARPERVADAPRFRPGDRPLPRVPLAPNGSSNAPLPGAPPAPGAPMPQESAPGPDRPVRRGPPNNLPPQILTPEQFDSFFGEHNHTYSVEAFQKSLRGAEVSASTFFENQPIRVHSRPIFEGNRVVGVVQTASLVGDTQQAIDGVTRTLLLLFPGALALAALGGLLLTERALRPVRALTDAASEIRETNLSDRLPVSGEDEFSQLSTVLNGMLQRLENAFDRERRFAADASHELKTPLAIIKVNTSLALEDDEVPAAYIGTFRTIDRATDRANRIVTDLLLLAREGSGALKLRPETIPVSTLFRESLDALGSANPRITVQDPGNLVVHGDRHHLTRVLVNLMENALRYTPENSAITLSAWDEQNTLLLRVRDTGEGIPPEHLPHVLEPFYRVDAARTRESGGSGLGLSICQSIARAHGGSITVDSIVGKGTTVTLRLPASPDIATEKKALAMMR